MPETHASDVTLVEVLDDLRQEGYSGDFTVDADGQLCCQVCGVCQPSGEVHPVHLRRVEGATDPGDMAAVIATPCAACGQRGTAVVRFGPEAGPGDATLLANLEAPSHDETGQEP